jgi:hypothetical protein
MKECALDRNDERQFGCAAARGHGVSDVLIADDEAAAEDAQRLASTGYEENQSDVRVL